MKLCLDRGRSRSWFDVAVERRPRNAERPADVIDGILGIVVEPLKHLHVFGVERLGSPANAAARSGGGETSLGPLANEIPLKLGQGTEREGFLQAWAASFGAAERVCKDLSAACLGELVALQVKRLLLRGDAGVPDQHGSRRS